MSFAAAESSSTVQSCLSAPNSSQHQLLSLRCNHGVMHKLPHHWCALECAQEVAQAVDTRSAKYQA